MILCWVQDNPCRLVLYRAGAARYEGNRKAMRFDGGEMASSLSNHIGPIFKRVLSATNQMEREIERYRYRAGMSGTRSSLQHTHECMQLLLH